VQGGVSENGFSEAGFIKHRMIQYAVFEAERKSEFVAVVKVQSQHFTIFKFHIPESGFGKFGQAQVASRKFAGYESAVGHIGFRKVAASKYAIFIFAFCERVVFKI